MLRMQMMHLAEVIQFVHFVSRGHCFFSSSACRVRLHFGLWFTSMALTMKSVCVWTWRKSVLFHSSASLWKCIRFGAAKERTSAEPRMWASVLRSFTDSRTEKFASPRWRCLHARSPIDFMDWQVDDRKAVTLGHAIKVDALGPCKYFSSAVSAIRLHQHWCISSQSEAVCCPFQHLGLPSSVWCLRSDKHCKQAAFN